VIARYKYLVCVIQFGKPLDKIIDFLACSSHGYVARMNDYVGGGEILQLAVTVEGVGKVEEEHGCF